MSLKGSLQTVALPEVLHLLADTGKSGELYVGGTEAGGHLWFEHGQIAGHDVAGSGEAFDALFRLLRVDDGEFTFDSDAPTPEGSRLAGEASDVASALERAEARLGEWREIVAVVPSLEHRVHLVDEPPADSVTLDRAQWKLVVAVGAGGSIADVLSARCLDEFEGCRAVRDLVQASLVELSEPAAGAAEPEAGFEAAAWEQPVEESEEPEPVWDDGSEGPAAVSSEETAEPVDAARAEPEATAYPPLGSYGEGTATFAPASTAFAGPLAAQLDSPFGSDYTAADGDHYSSLRAALSEVEAAAESYDDPESFDEPGSFDGAGDEAAGAQDGDAPGTARDDAADGDAGADEAEDHAVRAEGRAALHALLAEVTSSADAYEDADAGKAGADAPVDGLTDRGPWTSTELESLEQMGGWRQEDPAAVVAGDAESPEPEAAFVVAEAGAAYEDSAAGAAYVGPEAAPVDESGEVPAGEEPINRGLLLKFLSSVRN